MIVAKGLLATPRLSLRGADRDTAVCLLASSRHYLFDKCLLLYVQSLTADDGRKDSPKHVECYSN